MAKEMNAVKWLMCLLALVAVVLAALILNKVSKKCTKDPYTPMRSRMRLRMDNPAQAIQDLSSYNFGPGCPIGNYATDSPQVQCIVGVGLSDDYSAFDNTGNDDDTDTNTERWCCCDPTYPTPDGIQDSTKNLRSYCKRQ